MNDVRVLCIRIGGNFPKDKWAADALLAEKSEEIRTMLAAWRPEKLEAGR